LVLGLASGLLLSMGSCAVDIGYYLLNNVVQYLPDLLSSASSSA
jgi:hypothetical protein